VASTFSPPSLASFCALIRACCSESPIRAFLSTLVVDLQKIAFRDYAETGANMVDSPRHRRRLAGSEQHIGIARQALVVDVQQRPVRDRRNTSICDACAIHCS
jgi:hypothetical protein